MFFPAAEVTIHDTWRAHGLCGTGSHDFSVEGVHVPETRLVRPMVGRRHVDGALAAFPNFSLLAAGVAAVSLGIARHAVDELSELGRDKRPLYSSRTLSQSGSAQSDLAKADAMVRSARAFLLGELADAWEQAVAGGRIDEMARGRIRLASVNAAQQSARAVDEVYTLAGGSSVHASSPLQRCLRDAHVATQHLMVSPRLYETLGKQLFGLDVDTSML
jgi:alkylation response protein AidB-like acyl-CoA dehydrogenase